MENPELLLQPDVYGGMERMCQEYKNEPENFKKAKAKLLGQLDAKIAAKKEPAIQLKEIYDGKVKLIEVQSAPANKTKVAPPSKIVR